MNYIIFEGNKYKLVPLNRIGIKRLDSKIIFIQDAKKINLKNLLKKILWIIL